MDTNGEGLLGLKRVKVGSCFSGSLRGGEVKLGKKAELLAIAMAKDLDRESGVALWVV